MEIVQNTALITVNATLVFQLISFLILVYLLHRLMLRPLSDIMQKRKEYVDQLEIDVEEGEARLIAIEEKLSARKKEFFSQASNLRKSLMEEATKAGTEIISEARAKVTEDLHEANRQSQEEAVKIREEFQKLAEELSDNIIDRVLDRRAA